MAIQAWLQALKRRAPFSIERHDLAVNDERSAAKGTVQLRQFRELR
jgi:hypothetical protein